MPSIPRSRIAISLTFAGALVATAPQQGTSATRPDPEWSELISSMDKMHQAMSAIAPSGDTDADFVRLMLPHHQGAIDMAKTELVLGKSRELRRLAQEIITDQQSEIELMELWLKRHGPKEQKTDPSSDPGRQGGSR